MHTTPFSQHPFLLWFLLQGVCVLDGTSGEVCDTLHDARARETHCRPAPFSSDNSHMVCLSDSDFEKCNCLASQSI